MDAYVATSGWRCMATLELDDSEVSLATLDVILPSYARALECEHSPFGYRWVDLLLHEASLGESPGYAAGQLIASLALSSQIFPSFRIVNGEQWIELAAHSVLHVEPHLTRSL